MFKKIAIGMVLTITILAFPVRLLELPQLLEAATKIFKGLLFIAIIFFLMNRENLLQMHLVLKKMYRGDLIKVLPVAILIVVYVVHFWSGNMQEYNGPTSLLLLTLAGTLVAASAEEVIFRGYMLNLLKKNGYTLLRSLVISSLIFSLIHIVNIFRYEDVWAILNQVIFAFALGMLFGSVYALTNNLLLVCIFHFFINIPSAVRRIMEVNETEEALSTTTLSENLLSTSFFIILMLPVLSLAYYYIKLVKKRHIISPGGDLLSVVK